MVGLAIWIVSAFIVVGTACAVLSGIGYIISDIAKGMREADYQAKLEAEQKRLNPSPPWSIRDITWGQCTLVLVVGWLAFMSIKQAVAG